MVRRLCLVLAVFLVGSLPVAAPAAAQETAEPLEVGAVAPDFELAAGTRYGQLQEPVRLGDYRGKTVVLAFFFRARTGG